MIGTLNNHARVLEELQTRLNNANAAIITLADTMEKQNQVIISLIEQLAQKGLEINVTTPNLRQTADANGAVSDPKISGDSAEQAGAVENHSGHAEPGLLRNASDGNAGGSAQTGDSGTILGHTSGSGYGEGSLPDADDAGDDADVAGSRVSVSDEISPFGEAEAAAAQAIHGTDSAELKKEFYNEDLGIPFSSEPTERIDTAANVVELN